MTVRNLIPRREDLFAPIEQHFHKFFEEFWNPKSLDSLKATVGFPKMNAYEKDGELILTISVSGMTADDIRVEVTPDNYLVLSGRMSEEYQSPEDAVWHIRELRQSAFERRLKLPDSVEGDPRAVLKDGMLTLKWSVKNAKKELPATKRIPIKTG
jgi:HSP20 family molecular chaperone IbpA